MNNNETKGPGSNPNRPAQPNQPNQRPNGRRRFNLMWIYAILAIVLIGVNFLGHDTHAPQEDIDQGKLIELLENQQVQRIDLVNGKEAEVYLNQRGLLEYFPDVTLDAEGTTSSPSYTYKIGSLERFEEMVETVQKERGIQNPVYINNVERKSWVSDFLIGWLPFIILIVVWIVIKRNDPCYDGKRAVVFHTLLGGKGVSLRIAHVKCQSFCGFL